MWGNWGNNVFYDPEKCGVEVVGSVDEQDLSYEYNTYLVVREKATGKLWAADDTGCSCPTPFDSITGFADMREIRTVEDFRRDVDYWKTKPHGPRIDQRDVDALEEKVRAALRTPGEVWRDVNL